MMAEIKVEKWITSDGKEYYIIRDENAYGGRGADHWFDAEEYTEATAKYAFKKRMQFNEFESFVKKCASMSLPNDFYERRSDFSYLFVVQEAYGDRTYYLDTRNKVFVSDWYSIGD